VGLTPSEVEKTLDLPINASIPQSNDVPASINQGRPIVLESPRHSVSQAIRKLAVDCAEGPAAAGDAPVVQQQPEVTPDAKRGGLLRRRAAK